jgi:hypothetical protein
MKQTIYICAAAMLSALALATGAEAATITSVTLKHKASPSKSPVVKVFGSGFGARPTEYSAAETSCGAYGKKNGFWFGEEAQNILWFRDHNAIYPFEWVAGIGTGPGNGSCVGIRLKKWTETEVVFKFGIAYGSFSDWSVYEGDEFNLAVAGATFTGKAT